jgi:2-haloacid dehalogenase
MTAYRPTVVAFDAVETLFSLDPVRVALADAGAGPRALELFFNRLLRDGFALAAAGDIRPFRDVAQMAAAFVLPEAAAETRERVLDAFVKLPAHADAEPAMARLTREGVRIVTLTNGGVAQTGALLHAAGLDRYVERVLPADEAGRWKPAPEPYGYAAHALGVPTERLALVAVHAWDVHGARRAGLVTGWASRLEHTFADIFEPPDVSGPDLVTVVDRLLALRADTVV